VAKNQFMPEKVRRPRDELRLAVNQIESLKDYVVTGSWRRKKETVGDLDIVVSPSLDFGQAVEDFIMLFSYEEIRGGSLKSEGIATYQDKPLLINLWRTPQVESWGAMMLYTTGPRDLNIMMRAKAQMRGWKLSQYSLVNHEGLQIDKGYVEGAKFEELEKDIFDHLEIEYITPQQREDWRKHLLNTKVNLGRSLWISSSRPGHDPHEVRLEQENGKWKAVECDCEWFTYHTSKGAKPCQHLARAEAKAAKEW